MTNKEKQEAENICGMIEEIKKGIVNAAKKCSQTEASAADLYTAMMMATADFISAYSKSTACRAGSRQSDSHKCCRVW